MVHEMVEIEKKGKPALLVVSGRFEHDAIASARAFGMPGVRYVVVPWLYRNLDPERAIQQTEAAFETLVGEMTADVDGSAGTGKLEPTQMERFEGSSYFDAFQVMNREFLNRDWGDGFPLLPATPEAVENMLKGTCLPRDQVVCDLPPGYGLATVEKIAINAAMAGALPEHMPVIIGALKAVSQMDPGHVKGFLMSTSSHASMLLVNGPIAKELNINGQGACMGPGRQNRANVVIGRAYMLCLKNIGYWYPGQMDMDTIGSIRKFTVCLSENEDASPWEPYHVEKGFKGRESVVSVLATKGEVDVADQGNYTAEGLLKTIAYNAIYSQWDLARTAESGGSSAMETIVLVPPDIARPCGEAGFSKKGAKQFIHMHAQFSLGKMAHYYPLHEEKTAAQWRWMLRLSEKELNDIWVPVRESADRYQLICVGADRAKPIIIPSGPVRPESVSVDQYRAG